MNETPPAVPLRKNSALAVWSLVLGILAIVLMVICIGPLFGLAAVICGHMALTRIKRYSEALEGRGLAIGGLVTGYLSIALIPLMIPFIGMLAAIAVPNFVKARDTAQANGCINYLRQLDSAVQQWALETGKTESDKVEPAAVARYMKDGVLPTCPAGGTYTFAATVGANPVVMCSHPGHALPTGSVGK